MILVVDDDEFQRDLIGMQLASLGWEHVLLAASGEEALAQFDMHGGAISAIISDLSMPGMDGLVLMRHLAQRGCRASIILLSGAQHEILHSASSLADAHGLNILGCLSKPCAPDKLSELLAGLHPQSARGGLAAVERRVTAERLMRALAANEFVPWYQPQVDAHSGATVGVEALARWPSEASGGIGPAVFVPALEAAGLADELFFAIARQVANDLARWRAQNIAIRAAINMSMATAHNLALPELLGQLVSDAGLRTSDFVIEVTESQLMVERTVALETLTRLSMMGFILSIDDFGTGFSSLVQLIDLPFRELKIDGSFVQRADRERKAQAVLHIAILLGSSLDMEVIAEGVETAEQLEFVRAAGGMTIQGYYIARPMPFAACTEWLVHAANI
jgi:EAL domain-containing protein (putative c-di-GMP-specific phosphodiesterase class I)